MGRARSELAVFLNVRLQSRRCPNKMLRPFAGTTLLDVCLDKVAALGWQPTYLAAHEPELLARGARHAGVTTIRRSAASAASNTDARLVFEALAAIPERWVFWINPCAPLLSVETLRGALEAFLAHDWAALTAVREVHGWFWAEDGRRLNRDHIDTAASEPVWQACHAFHAYEGRRFLAEGRPFRDTPGDPHLYPVPEAEAHDIDTEHEFELGEYLYRRRQHG